MSSGANSLMTTRELASYLRGLPLRELDLSLNDGPNTFISNSDHFPFSLAGNSAVWAVTSPAPPGGGWVHTQADTLDKLDLRTLRQTTSAAARLLLRMALEPDELPRGLIPPETVKHNVIQAGFEESLRFNGRWPF